MSSILFPPFRLDPVNERLWRGAQEIALRPKTFSVLRYLAERRGQLVTKEELLNTLWPGIYVTDGVLMACIRDVRKALGDDPRAPQFIATLRGRGYRFIAPLTPTAQPVSGSKFQVPSREEAREGSLPSSQVSSLQPQVSSKAIGYLTRGLELLRGLPDLPERIQQEITLLLTLGRSVMTAKGSAAPEVERVYTRAHALCRQVGETPQLLPVLLGLQMYYEVRGDLQPARELAEQCLKLAQRFQASDFLLWAHFALGQTLFQLGDLISARAPLEQGIALYNSRQYPSQVPVLAGPGIGCFCWSAFSLWLLGYPDQALQRIHEALGQAQNASDPYLVAIALSCAAALHAFRREDGAAYLRAEEAVRLSADHGFAQWLGFATVMRGWALAEQGYCDEGIAQMRQGTTTYQSTGAELSLPYQFTLLAEGCGKAGRTEEGLSALVEAFAVVNKSDARFSEAELYRLKGTLTLQCQKSPKQVQGKPKASQGKFAVTSTQAEAEAEACFQKAIAIACRQSAKAWELRAVVSLSRLWQKQGKKSQARKLLSETHVWFTEGFDTADLQEAKALLEELR